VLLSPAEDRRWQQIEERVGGGERLSLEDGVFLMSSPDVHRLGRLANQERERRHGNQAFFVVNRHLNPTNYCVYSCTFCAFAKKPGQEGGYRMPLEDIRRLARDDFEEGLSEVHIVGGIDPKLPYDYYIDVLRVIHQERPEIHLKAYTMIEVEWLARIGKRPVSAVLDDLLEAGLGSCPGGGVEVLSDRVHAEIFPGKLSPDEWLTTARAVQQHGVPMNATMLYGHIETVEERVHHMIRIRELQDETGGFMTFIPLAFHPENTGLAELPGPSGLDDLRVVATSRLMVDNVDHIKTYWIMHGLSVAQVALWYGADDMDGTVVIEKITHDAGAKSPLGVTRDELIRRIRESGREPVQRDTVYSSLQAV
jgi:aminodeoxyfutalosine synthase